MRFFRGILSLLVAFTGLTGCETLYNAANDKSAQDAGKAFAEAGLGSALEAERAALIKNQTERQQLVKRSQLAFRDASIALFMDAAKPEASWGALQAMTDSRIELITGSTRVKVAESCRVLMPGGDPDPLAASKHAQTGASQLAIARRNLDFATVNANQRRSQIAIALAKFDEPPPPSCAKTPWVLPQHLQSDAALAALAGTYPGLCATVDIAARCIADLSTGQRGLLAEKNAALADIAQAKVDIAKLVSERRKAYADLLVEAKKPGGTPGVAAQFAKDLKAALDAIEKVQSKSDKINAHPILSRLGETGRVTALAEKGKLLEAYIEALSGTSSATATHGQHRLYLAAALANAITSESAPPTAGLLMEAQLNRQQSAAAQARIERATEAERIIKNQRDYLLDELGFLLDTQAQLAEAGPCTGKPLYAGLASGAANPCSMHAAKALLSFTAAWTAGRLPVEQADYLRIDQSELAALDEAEAALVQTEGVLKTAITQIGLLNAGGIKPEDLAALAQALSLPAIAVRVK